MSASVEEKDLSRQKRHVVDIKNTFSLLLLSVLDSIWRTGIVLERETVLDCPSLVAENDSRTYLDDQIVNNECSVRQKLKTENNYSRYKKSNLHYSRGITPKRVTSGRAYRDMVWHLSYVMGSIRG